MALVMVGANPRRTSFLPLLCALDAEGARSELVAALGAQRGVSEVMLLAGAGRVEVYAVVDEGVDGYEAVMGCLIERGLVPSDATAHGYFAAEGDAAAHLFAAVAAVVEVAGSAEGPPGVEEGRARSGRQLVAGAALGALAAAARALAARLDATRSGASEAAWGDMVAALARRVFDHLERRTVLVVGADPLAVAAAEALGRAGAGQFVAVGLPDAAGAADAAGAPVATGAPASTAALEALPVVLGNADVVVVSPGVTAAFDKRLVKGALRARRGRPLLLVDTSDGDAVEGRVAALDDVFLYNRTDVARLVRDTPGTRGGAGTAATQLVADAVRDFSYQLA